MHLVLSYMNWSWRLLTVKIVEVEEKIVFLVLERHSVQTNKNGQKQLLGIEAKQITQVTCWDGS